MDTAKKCCGAANCSKCKKKKRCPSCPPPSSHSTCCGAQEAPPPICLQGAEMLPCGCLLVYEDPRKFFPQQEAPCCHHKKKKCNKNEQACQTMSSCKKAKHAEKRSNVTGGTSCQTVATSIPRTKSRMEAGVGVTTDRSIQAFASARSLPNFLPANVTPSTKNRICASRAPIPQPTGRGSKQRASYMMVYSTKGSQTNVLPVKVSEMAVASTANLVVVQEGGRAFSVTDVPLPTPSTMDVPPPPEPPAEVTPPEIPPQSEGAGNPEPPPAEVASPEQPGGGDMVEPSFVEELPSEEAPTRKSCDDCGDEVDGDCIPASEMLPALTDGEVPCGSEDAGDSFPGASWVIDAWNRLYSTISGEPYPDSCVCGEGADDGINIEELPSEGFRSGAMSNGALCQLNSESQETFIILVALPLIILGLMTSFKSCGC